MTSLLEHFSEIPEDEFLFEIAGELQYAQKNMDSPSEINLLEPLRSEAKGLLQTYPSFETEKGNKLTAVQSQDSAKSAFLEHNSISWRNFLSAWFELGLVGALKEVTSLASDDSNGAELTGWLRHGAGAVLYATEALTRLGSPFFAPKLPSEDLIAAWSSIHNWTESPIRAFAWHPETIKFAVCTWENSVVVCSACSTTQATLKHSKQKNVAALAWRPLCASVLAVACKDCVLLWTVEPTSLATRPATSLVQQLQHGSLSPVTSLAWSHGGDLLFASSPSSPSVVVWSGYGSDHATLTRRGDGGVPLLALSPDGARLLATSVSNNFRVWDSRNWTCEKWTQLAAPVQCACWSPDGAVLLFCTRTEPTVYALSFAGGSQPGAAVALPLIETSAPEDQPGVGGCVQNMTWSERGERLAVQFRDSPHVAVFLTRLRPTLEALPCGWVTGRGKERALLTQFQPSFDRGALLTVLWDSGRVQHYPFLYTSDASESPQEMQQTNASILIHSLLQ